MSTIIQTDPALRTPYIRKKKPIHQITAQNYSRMRRLREHGTGARTPSTGDPGKLRGAPSSLIHSPSGHSGVMDDPGPSHPGGGPTVHCPQEKETVTDSVDKAPGVRGNPRKTPGPARGPGRLAGGRGTSAGSRGGKRGHEVHRAGFGRCRDRKGWAGALQSKGPARPARRPSPSPLWPPRGTARWCRAPPGGVPAGGSDRGCSGGGAGNRGTGTSPLRGPRDQGLLASEERE